MKIKYLAGVVSCLLASSAARAEITPYSPAVQSLFVPAGDKPEIHGPLITGVSPRRPFLYRIPATGKAPLKFAVAKLPSGLKVDTKTGIITGSLEKAGNYEVTFTVSGPAGKTSRSFTIVCGPGKLALTPPMGWNSWGVLGKDVTALKVREQADWMIRSGLAARGFQYIIVDDAWQARRGPDGTINPNRRFGSMRALANYVHERGLKIGLVSSPNEHTPTGHAGSAGFEEKDAARYADWGIDYLKYDWSPEETERSKSAPAQMRTAYSRMRAALDKVNRDIVFSASTYGFGSPVQEWIGGTGANSWTLRPSLVDSWGALSSNGFSLSSIASSAGPGGWNDPGTLMLGRSAPNAPKFTSLTADEQRTQVTLWSLTAAPLMLSCDLRQLDPNNFFRVTTALLTNPEVLAVNQDPLGKPASRMGDTELETWARPLADGTLAVGIFNSTTRVQQGSVRWPDLGLNGAQPVRDLWQRRDLGLMDGYTLALPPHGSMMLKIGRAKPVAVNPRWYATGQRKTPESRIIVPVSNQEVTNWRYTVEQPESNWVQPNFGDRGWKSGGAGFGKANGEMLSRTDWTGSEIWMRKSVDFGEPLNNQLWFSVLHGGDTEIYLNGVLVANLTGSSRDYVNVPLGEAAQTALRRGWNTVAVHSRQGTAQGLDIGIRQRLGPYNISD